MLIKKITLFLLLGSLTGLFAAGQNTGNVVPMTDKEAEKYEKMVSANSEYLNPELTRLKKEQVTKLLEETYLNTTAKPPETIAETQANENGLGIPTSLRIQYLTVSLENIMKNPELEEATGIKTAWFQRVLQCLKQFKGAAEPMNTAITVGKEAEYAQARTVYVQMADAMNQLMSSPVRLSKKEYEALHKKNTMLRKQQLDLLEARYKAYKKSHARDKKKI